MPVIIEGLDNYSKPRQLFADKLAAMTDAEYIKETESRIWLAAYAANNPRSDYHWQVSVCYDVAVERGNRDLYTKAFNQARESV